MKIVLALAALPAAGLLAVCLACAVSSVMAAFMAEAGKDGDRECETNETD